MKTIKFYLSLPFNIFHHWAIAKIWGGKFDLKGTISYCKFMRDGGFEAYKKVDSKEEYEIRYYKRAD